MCNDTSIIYNCLLLLGTGAIIISPTRELSLQIYGQQFIYFLLSNKFIFLLNKYYNALGVLRDLIETAEYPQTHGLIMGGANRKAEADKLLKGN